MEYKAALERFKQGATDDALREMRLLSLAGHAGAQVFLGWLSEKGEVVPVDLEEARRCYTAAAEQGNSIGRFYLGMLLLRGGEVSIAAQWIHLAAEDGYPPALYRLGLLHEQGAGVERDEVRSLQYMRRAATAGHPFAQRWIARRGVRGYDGLKGFLRALLWFASVPIVASRLVWRNETDQNLLDD